MDLLISKYIPQRGRPYNKDSNTGPVELLEQAMDSRSLSTASGGEAIVLEH